MDFECRVYAFARRGSPKATARPYICFSAQTMEGVPGEFAAVSIRKRGSEISVGISESKQPQAEASDPSEISHAFNQSGETMSAEAGSSLTKEGYTLFKL